MNAHWAQASRRGLERGREDFPHGARCGGQRDFETENPACPGEVGLAGICGQGCPTVRFTALPAKGQRVPGFSAGGGQGRGEGGQ